MKSTPTYIVKRRGGWSNIMIAVYMEIAFQLTCSINDDCFNMYDRKTFYDFMMAHDFRMNNLHLLLDYNFVEICAQFDSSSDRLIMKYFHKLKRSPQANVNGDQFQTDKKIILAIIPLPDHADVTPQGPE